MRKIDYQHLAEAIRKEIESAKTWLSDADELNIACARGRAGAAERVAREFARTASVDRAAFLKACGIE